MHENIPAFCSLPLLKSSFYHHLTSCQLAQSWRHPLTDPLPVLTPSRLVTDQPSRFRLVLVEPFSRTQSNRVHYIYSDHLIFLLFKCMKQQQELVAHNGNKVGGGGDQEMNPTINFLNPVCD